jgi:Ice-binding-like
MDGHRLKPAFIALFLTIALVACGAGNANSTIPTTNGFAQNVSSGVQSLATPDGQFAPLGYAGHFAILAGATVTSTGQTRITGNVGISPGTAMTGFPPGLIDGKFYPAGPVSAKAKLDLTAAYNDIMGLSRNPILVAGNLGGQTLKPGLYKSSSSLAVSSGNLTLDGDGNRKATFIFQVASTFTMTTGRKIFLTNGAKAENIYWAVGSSATFGTHCSFYGNLIAHQSISMATGTVMTGRAMARIGAVTMEGNTVVRPAPAP